MKKVTDHIVNQQILSGHFPKSKLIPLNLYHSPAIDVESLVKEGVNFLKEEGETFLLWYFSNVSDFFRVNDTLELPDPPNAINYWINLGLAICRLDEDTEITKKTFYLRPIVTRFDRYLWHFARHMKNTEEIGLDNSDELFQFALTWGYLLRRVQQKELETGYSIKVEAMDSFTMLLQSILGEWDSIDKEYLIELTDKEKNELQELFQSRQEILDCYKKERADAKLISEESNATWELYIKLLNELSERETTTIDSIKNSKFPPMAKIRAINDYNSFITEIMEGSHQIDNQPIVLQDIYKSVEKRSECASNYVCLYDDTENPFRLDLEAVVLAVEPRRSFNYLYICYHYFRLSPTKKNAMTFVSCALKSLMNNLGIKDDAPTSFKEKIGFFCSKAFSFVDQQRQIINEMSFQTLQGDEASVIPGFHTTTFMKESFNKRWRDLLLEQIAETSGRSVDNILPHNPVSYSKEDLQLALQREETEYQKMEDTAIARRIVVSINIIYMMRKVLLMIIDNEELKSMYDDLDALEQFERKLYKIDSRIERVYSYLDDEEREMSQYREEEGFDPERLARKESEEEKKRNEQVFEKVLSAVNSIMQDIEKQDIEELMQTKERIRKEISECPECEAKEQLAVPIDNAIVSLCTAIVSNCKKNADNFIETKAGLVDYLGKDGHRLPEKALDTLTTAEILYNRYAIQDFADKGFDYSSISALYYQAFEVAINEMIWKQYAKDLNELISDGRIDEIYSGYLPGDEDNVRDNYMEKTKPYGELQVKRALMLGNIKHLLAEVREYGSAPEFCKYFADICGFHDEWQMFDDKGFLDDLNSFRYAIYKAIPNRNNASHGGNIIDMHQCRLDKVAVLSELEEVRRYNLGLIQQLLYIVL